MLKDLGIGNFEIKSFAQGHTTGSDTARILPKSEFGFGTNVLSATSHHTMVSGWVFLLPCLSHLFTSASLKGWGPQPHKAGVSEPLSGDIQTIYHQSQSGLSEQPCQSPLLTMLQSYLLWSLNMSSSLTSWGLVFLLPEIS